MESNPAPRDGLRAARYCASIAALLVSASAIAVEPALECYGVKSDDPDIRYELTVTGLDANRVIVIDSRKDEKCSCKFGLSGFSDKSKGMVPGYTISMAYQSCDAGCSGALKRQIKAYIRVEHGLVRKDANSTPFVGNQMSNCDRFSIDVPALQKLIP